MVTIMNSDNNSNNNSRSNNSNNNNNNKNNNNNNNSNNALANLRCEGARAFRVPGIVEHAETQERVLGMDLICMYVCMYR